MSTRFGINYQFCGVLLFIFCLIFGKAITRYYVISGGHWRQCISFFANLNKRDNDKSVEEKSMESLESQSFVQSDPQSQPVQEVESQNTHLISSILRKSNPQSQPGQEVESQNTHLETQSFVKSNPQPQPVQELAVPGAEQKRVEVQEGLTPNPCTKCSGKGSVTVPAKKKCTKCLNGRIVTGSCRNCLGGWCANTEALVYPSVKKRKQWIESMNSNTEYRSVNGVSERLAQISKSKSKSKSEAENRLLNASYMNTSMIMSPASIGESESGKEIPTLERLSDETGKRINQDEFNQLIELQYLPQGVSKTMGLLHIVPCGKRKGFFGKGYDCANLGKENEHIPSPKNECSECLPCSQCGGDLLCNRCDGSGLVMVDCQECENGYISQSEEVACSQCGGDRKIEPKY